MTSIRRSLYAASALVSLARLMGGDCEVDIDVDDIRGLIPNVLVIAPYGGGHDDYDDCHDPYYCY